MSSRLLPPREEDAAVVAGWSRSADEARRWCSVVEHPFPPERVRGWWTDDAVRPWVLVEEPEAEPVGYGELWLDEEEDEVELARLIVAPARRRSGLGRALVAQLVAAASATGLSGCLLRVAPDNAPAIALYRAAGFAEVDPERTAGWNQGQPTGYVWFEWPNLRPEPVEGVLC
jgi:ribosomal protein S18 acetylase RimI-like enzyme